MVLDEALTIKIAEAIKRSIVEEAEYAECEKSRYPYPYQLCHAFLLRIMKCMTLPKTMKNMITT